MLGLLVLMTSTFWHPTIAARHTASEAGDRRRRRRIAVMSIISEAKIEVDPEAPARRVGGQLAVALQVVVAGAEVRELRVAAAVRGPPVEVASADTELGVRYAVHAAHLR